MTAASWIATGTAPWSNAADWSGGVAPGSTTDVTLGGNTAYSATLDVAASIQSLTISNSLATLVDTLPSSGMLTIAGTLANGAGTIELGGGPGGGWISVGGDLTNGGTITAVTALDGGLPAGASGQTNVHFIDVAGTFTNSGTLGSDAAGGVLSEVLVTAGKFVNTGTVQSSATTGGFVELNTTTGSNTDQIVNNGTFTTNGGGIGVMAPVFINNGAINLTGGNDDLEISSTYAGGPFTAQTVTSGTGTITLGGSAGGVGSRLRFIDSQTFASGTIVMSGNAAMITDATDGNNVATPSILTFGAASTIKATAVQTDITSWYNTSNHIIANGTIDASAAGGQLTIDPGLFTNNGTIAVTNGDTVMLAAATDGTGTVTLAGGSTLDVVSSMAAGGNVTFADAAADTLHLRSAATFAATINGFAQGDSIDLAGISASSATWAGGVLAVQTTTGTINLALAGNYAGTGFIVSNDGMGGSLITLGNSVPVGQTYTLTTKADTVSGGAGQNTIVAGTGTLNHGDHIDGGSSGANVLELVGGGAFNLASPLQLVDIATVAAAEGASSARQTVTLRSGLDVTVNVASSSAAGAGITVIGANDASTINLGNGNDTVRLGSARETVNGGAGHDTFEVTAATIGATINGGTGPGDLVVSGGGTAAMGSNISHVARVDLAASDKNWTFTANATAGMVIDDHSTGQNDVIRAGAAGQTLTGGSHDQTFVGFGSGLTTYADSAAAFNGASIRNFSTGDVIDITGLKFGAGTGLTFNPDGSGAGDLVVTQGGAFATEIHLFGNFGSGSFSATSDGHGGTLIHAH